MSVHTARGGRPVGRIARLIGYEGPVATLLLAAFQYFTLSVSFVASILPILGFHALVGWQATHLAVWLNAASLLVAFPAVFALLTAGRRLLDDGADARAGKTYWSTFGGAIRGLWWGPVAVSVLALLLGYDVALMGASDAAFLLVVATALIAFVLIIAIACVTPLAADRTPLALIVRSAGAVTRRPHIALSWLMLFALAGAATTIPLLGALAVLFLPAVAAVLVHVCNRALGFPPASAGESAPR